MRGRAAATRKGRTVKRAVSPLARDGCRLRLLEESDIERLRCWRNQDHIRKWFVHSEPIEPDRQRAWWDAYRFRDDDYVFVIEEVAEGLGAVGAVALYHIDHEQKRAECGRLMIGEPAARGRGLARTATELVIEFAFDQLGLREVYLEVFSDNEPAIGLYRSCGFEETGRRERLLCMHMLRPEQQDG